MESTSILSGIMVLTVKATQIYEFIGDGSIVMFIQYLFWQGKYT